MGKLIVTIALALAFLGVANAQTLVPLPATIETCGGAQDTHMEPCLANKCTSVGQFFDMQITGTTAGNVYGFRNYTTSNTVLSKAAVHAGFAAVGQTKVLRFTCMGPQTSFRATKRNDVWSLYSDAAQTSFKVTNPFEAGTPAPTYASCDPFNVTSGNGQLSARQINDMLYLTNLARRSVQPKARAMPLVKWSDTLATFAREVALKCNPSKHTEWGDRNDKHGFWAIGENIGGGWGSEHNFTHGYLGPIWQWINEAAFWGPYPAHDAHATSGHYNMMIFDQTTDMGCAYNHCPAIQYEHVWICMYGEGGNYPNTASYELPEDGVAAQCALDCGDNGVGFKSPDLLPFAFTPSKLPCPQAPTPLPENFCGADACMKGKCEFVGQTFTFTVTGSTYGNIWGTDRYSDDSFLGEMALHLGLLKEGETALLTAECFGPVDSLEASFRNGVQSQHWGQPYAWTITLTRPGFNTQPPAVPGCTGACMENRCFANGDTINIVVTGEATGPIIGSAVFAETSNPGRVAVYLGLVAVGQKAEVTALCTGQRTTLAAGTQNGVTSTAATTTTARTFQLSLVRVLAADYTPDPRAAFPPPPPPPGTPTPPAPPGSGASTTASVMTALIAVLVLALL